MKNNSPIFNPSSKFWLNLFNNLSGMFFICLNSPDWNMVYISDGSIELTGYNPNELLHNKLISYASLVHPEDYDWLYEKCINELNNKIDCNNEYRIICKKGKVKWVRQIANGIYNDDGELLFIEGYIEDITSEKDSSLISKAFTSYQDTINNTSIVSITDKKGKIIFANELFCKCSKYSRQELVGKSHKIINSGNHSKEFFSEMWKTINSGKIWRGEIKNKAKDGSFYWVDTTISPIFNDNNEIENFLSIRTIITDKKEQEENLVKTLKLVNDEKDFNHNVFSSLTSNIAIIDNKGNIIKTNKSWDEFYIKNNGDLEKNHHKQNYLKTCLNSIKYGDSDAETAYNGIKKLLKGKIKIFEYIYPCHSQDEKRWFLLRVTPYIGALKGAVLSHYNITEQKEYQIKTEEITKKIQSIYNASIFVIMISTDKNGLIQSINSGAEKILGYTESELINKPLLNIYLDSEIKKFSKKLSKKYGKTIDEFDIFKHNLGYKKTKSFEFTHIKKDGSAVVALLSVSDIKNSNGEITGYLITAIDISDRKLIEEKMKKNEEMLTEAQSMSKVGSWEYFYDSKTLNISKEIYNIHGINSYKNSSNIDILYKYIHPDDIQEVKNTITKAQKNSKAILITYRIITPLGNTKWLERKECYIRDNNGNLLEIKGTLQDITEIKKKELSQIQLVEELNKKNNELMQFNYIVSHNLRSPVAKIMSLTNLMNIVEEEERNEIIDYLSISAKQLDEVIKDLNHILSSKSAINDIREEISFKDLLVRIFDSLEKQIIESNAIINNDIDKDFSHIVSIKSYLESIFYNLISNSIKYRSNTRQLEISIYINKTKNNFIINVIDNGIGIDLKRHSKDLFVLYKRFNYSVEGKGMGLHMTKNQVEALGGKISIASKLNEGTVITVILPNKSL